MEGDLTKTAYRELLVPFDGSQGSWKALPRALLLAHEQGAEIAAISVEGHLPATRRRRGR